MPPPICLPAQPTLLRSFGRASLHSCARGGFGLRLPASASLRRDGPPTQRLATVTRSRGGFDESTPTQGSAMATSPRRALRPPPPSHKRSDRGPRQALRRRQYAPGAATPPPLLSDAPSLPSHHLSFGPSNFPLSSLFAHDFSFNYYNAINKITKAHHRAWHQQVCHPAQPTHLRSIGRASLPLLPRGGCGLRLPASASLRRDGPPTQRLATVARCRGGFDESTPTQGSAMAPTCGELCDPPPTRSGGYPRPPLLSAPPALHPEPLFLPIRSILK